MEFVKHKYSKRVYEVKRDHGPNSFYLSSFPWVREMSQGYLGEFFTPCEGPVQDSPIGLLEEVKWEDRKIIRDTPLVVVPPKRVARKEPKKPVEATTLGDLCKALGITPSSARRALRASKVEKPEAGWVWEDPQELKRIKRILRKSK